MSPFYCYDGKFIPSGDPVIGPDSRAFRYGDGVFETIRLIPGKIPLWDQHCIRYLKGMETLGFELPAFFATEILSEKIFQLVRKNGITGQARVRIMFFRDNGGVFDPVSDKPHYLIQAWDLPMNYQRLNENGLDIVVFPNARKSTDYLSNLKSNNFLCYLQGAAFAKQQHANEALVLNSFERIADACTANVFWVKQGQIFTNPLSEGPVAGVMRAWLLEQLPLKNMPVREEVLTEELLMKADEVFLTNATYGIRWVKSLWAKQFVNTLTRDIFHNTVSPLFT
jgi:branched-chain amino acid aminotransferase